jgi:hypothetical protein
MPASMTTELLHWLDPGALPPKEKKAMSEIGPFLWRGFTLKEIGTRLDPPRSGDYVGNRIAEVRQAIAQHVLDVAGDELPAELRARLEQYAGR